MSEKRPYRPTWADVTTDKAKRDALEAQGAPAWDIKDFRAILAFESLDTRVTGFKHEACRELFGVGLVRYLQRLNQVLDTHEALRHDPVLVHRLLTLRADRLEHRSARTFRTPRP